MLILFITLSILAIILIAVDRKTESTRFLACVCSFSALGGLSVVIEKDIMKYLSAYFYSNSYIMVILIFLSGLCASLAYYLAPTALLIYGIVYSNLFQDKWDRLRAKVITILLIPTGIMYFLVPLYPAFKTPPIPTSIWVAPYVLFSNGLMVYSFIQTKQTTARQQKLLTCIIVLPGTLMSLLTNYLLPAFNISQVYGYNVVIIVLQFCAFVFFGINKGALGVKLAFERQYVDKYMKSVTSGTALLNHTIKNEVIKISMCMDNIEGITASGENNLLQQINESIKIVKDSTNYLNIMVNKIQSQVRDIILDEKPYELNKIIDESIKLVTPFITGKSIKIIREFKSECMLQCDGMHLQETMVNILNNAIEALGTEGEITIVLVQKNKKLILSIADNGPGISKENLPHIIEPLFSTKHRTKNFGLGLTYCYGVMQQHGGSLEVESEIGVGTKVLLSFYAKKVLNIKLTGNSGET